MVSKPAIDDGPTVRDKMLVFGTLFGTIRMNHNTVS